MCVCGMWEIKIKIPHSVSGQTFLAICCYYHTTATGNGRRATAVLMLRHCPLPRACSHPRLTPLHCVFGHFEGSADHLDNNRLPPPPPPSLAVMLSAVYSGIARSRSRYNRKLFYLLLIAVHKTLPTTARGFRGHSTPFIVAHKAINPIGPSPFSSSPSLAKPRIKLKSYQNQNQLTNSTRLDSIRLLTAAIFEEISVCVCVNCMYVCVCLLYIYVCIAIDNICAIEMKQSKTQIGAALVQLQVATRKKACQRFYTLAGSYILL